MLLFLALIGIVVYIAIIPIIEQTTKLICTAIECLLSKMYLQIAKSQKDIDEIQGKEQTVSYPIGFQMPEEEEIYEDE